MVDALGLEHASTGHSHTSDRGGEPHYYLIGGGIASLAAAVFLCRDARVCGRHVTIIEALDSVGGSLDAEGAASHGYVMRGGRVFDSTYACTYDLFSEIPARDNERSVTQEILDWNNNLAAVTKSRLLRDGRRIEDPEFDLSTSAIESLADIAHRPESSFEAKAIEDYFDEEFFRSNFWLMWSSTFGFRKWHSAMEFRRYLRRFAHMVPGFNQLRGTIRTTYNQYDSLIRPLHKWLCNQGVTFAMNTRVTGIEFVSTSSGSRPCAIDYMHGSRTGRYIVNATDQVIATLGSMTEGTTQGAMDRPARYNGKPSGGAWSLWEDLARRHPEFGRPWAFSQNVEQSQFLSFTTTLRDQALFEVLRQVTGDDPAQGGIVTLARSSWLISLVIPRQPHFPDQPEDVSVLWGYGLSVNTPGDFIRKPMLACTGREIMTEVLGHLGMPSEGRRILQRSVCIPSHIPYATAQFSQRQRGDRPAIIPDGYSNLAFIGQFCELPDDVVFTVEYSVRSAQTAVYRLLDLHKDPPPVVDLSHSVRDFRDALAERNDDLGGDLTH